MIRLPLPLPVLFMASLAACSSNASDGVVTDAGLADVPPVDVTGAYTSTITNGANGCELANWNAGDSSGNIPVTITQSGTAISADVGGLAGAYLDLAVGIHVFTGTATGSHLTLSAIGTRSANRGSCTWTYEATLDATLTGNALNGTVTWRARTNNVPDCGSTATCASTQTYVASRPPR